MKLLSIAFFLLVLLISGCRFSPWEQSPDCPSSLVHIGSNLEKVKSIEQTRALGSTFKVALIGDPQRRSLGFYDTVEAIGKRSDIDFAFILGDIADHGLEMEYDWVCKSLRNMDIPFFAVIGNHDSISFGPQIWAETFGPYDYSVSFLGTKFIAYNDNAYEFPDVPNRQWLAEEAYVASGEVRYHTFALSHIPPLPDVHSADESRNFREFLYNQNIGHTFHGHLHKFHFWYDEFGVGHTITSDTDSVKYSVLTVSPTNLKLEFCSSTCAEVAL